MSKKLPKIIVVAGPNASGKSALGIELALRYNGEVISADSRQIYRGFDLCCGKVTAEERATVPHHLLDVAVVGDNYTVYDYQQEVYKVIDDIISRGKVPIIVGGTGLYIASVVYGYDLKKEVSDNTYRELLESKVLSELQEMVKELGVELNNSDFNNKRRLVRVLEKNKLGNDIISNNSRFEALQLGTLWPKEILDDRIRKRAYIRLEDGMLEEVREYLNEGANPDNLDRLGLDYRCITKYVQGKYNTYEEFGEELVRADIKYAKRQFTWFRKDKNIKWLDMTGNYLEEACLLVEEFLDK